jgi:hypothetical protein
VWFICVVLFWFFQLYFLFFETGQSGSSESVSRVSHVSILVHRTYDNTIYVLWQNLAMAINNADAAGRESTVLNSTIIRDYVARDAMFGAEEVVKLLA